MAWRIDESVIRGEIDNRVRGRITGRIWFAGRDEPLALELTGNAWRDLAGHRLEFMNPQPKPGDLAALATLQLGAIGDCTASRKVKVPDVSMEEVMELYKQRKPFPWHWGNSLYLEWFSTANGRVMIESANYMLTIDPESAWEMTVEEEKIQRQANAAAMAHFMGELGDAVAPDNEDKNPTAAHVGDDECGEGKPLTEAEAEKMQEESDRLADRINARVDREGIENYERILNEELNRRRAERGEEPLTREEEQKREEWLQEMNRAAEEAANNPDPGLEADLDRKHPLAERAFELSVRLMEDSEERGWVPADATAEHPVADFVSSVMSAAAKFSGALDGDWPPGVDFCASHIVLLKRARGFLDDAMLAAESCSQQSLVDAAWLAGMQCEINKLGRECDVIIAELRAKLERGFD